MAAVTFIFNKEKDLKNIWRTCNHNSPWASKEKSINDNVLSIAKGKKFEECKTLLADYYLKIHSSPLIRVFVESMNKSWLLLERDFIERLEKITKRKLCSNEIKGFVTTAGRCPYDEKEMWFMVNFFSSIAESMKTAAHEIMHLQFHKYCWDKVEKEVGKDKTADLKEALTVLLNLEFRDLWFVEDKGYESHKELREFIKMKWTEKKDFEALLEDCIAYLKEQ